MARKKTTQKIENGTIELTLEQIEKSFGKGAVMRMSESSEIDETIQSIPTGSIGLDYSLGIGGYPRGRVVEIATTDVREHSVYRRTLQEVHAHGAYHAHVHPKASQGR